MTRKPPSKLDRLYKSHLKLLRLVRGQIQELGELRKVILEIRPQPHTEVDKDGRTWHGQAVWPPLHGPQVWDNGIRFGVANSTGKEFDVPPNDWPRL